MDEVQRMSLGDPFVAVEPPAPWRIRALVNLVPRVPECCTGGRNESYVVVEDPRRFAEGARGREDLLYTGLLPPSQFYAVLRCCVDVARRSYANPAVAAVLIRKNQGRDSGASQPHVHTQVIGSDLPFPPVARDREVLARERGLWKEIVDFAEQQGFIVGRRGGFVSYFCPIGTFPRSYEVAGLHFQGRITSAADRDLADFAALLHEILQQLGPIPLEYDVHDGDGVPLHARVNARHLPYSNVGGTLNLPAAILARAPRLPES